MLLLYSEALTRTLNPTEKDPGSMMGDMEGPGLQEGPMGDTGSMMGDRKGKPGAGRHEGGPGRRPHGTQCQSCTQLDMHPILDLHRTLESPRILDLRRILDLHEY